MVIIKKRRIYSCLATFTLIAVPLYHFQSSVSYHELSPTSTTTKPTTTSTTRKYRKFLEGRFRGKGRHLPFPVGARSPAEISANANWCNGLRYRQGAGVKTGLASFPGSGNTWVRYLLQQVSGIYTGSIYTDGSLQRRGFAEYKQDQSVLVVKTHESGPKSRSSFNKTILLIRDPVESILAEFNRREGGHTGHARNMQPWKEFLSVKINVWRRFNLDWLTNVGPERLLVVSYAKLVSDLPSQLKRMADFLGISISKESLDCTLQRQQGMFKRRKSKNQNTKTKDSKLAAKIIEYKTEVKLAASKFVEDIHL